MPGRHKFYLQIYQRDEDLLDYILVYIKSHLPAWHFTNYNTPKDIQITTFQLDIKKRKLDFYVCL